MSDGSQLYHLVAKSEWKAATDKGVEYYPPTYAADGFVHLTANPSLLLEVANHFYKDDRREYLVLVLNPEKLRGTVKFEAAAAVGDKETKTGGYAKEAALFPHLYNSGIGPSALVDSLEVRRDASGTFLSIAKMSN